MCAEQSAHTYSNVVCRHPSPKNKNRGLLLTHPISAIVLSEATTVFIGTVKSTWLEVWWERRLIIVHNLAMEG